MNRFQSEDDVRKQLLAEAAERAGAPPSNDAEVASYRLVMRAAARPLSVQLPADFACSVAALVSVDEAPSLLDRLTPIVCLALLAVFGVTSSGHYLVEMFRQLDALGAGKVPWPMLGAAVLAMGAVGLSDRWMRRS